MEAAGGNGRSRWGTAVALGGAVLLLSVLPSFPLIALPLAVFLLTLRPYRTRSAIFALAVLVWAFVVFPVAGSWAQIGRGWALLLAGCFAAAALVRPGWSFVSRALLALGAALAAAGLSLWLAGSWDELSWTMGQHFRSMSLLTWGELAARMPDSRWIGEFSAAATRVAEWQARLFPALLALQSLAALGLAWWAFMRIQEPGARWRALRPLREFRFNDQLVWVVIAGMLLLLLPLGSLAAGAGQNALVFMGALYALRGVAVFVYLAGSAPSVFSVVFGALAAVFLYPIVLTAALLVGLGDTWLDVRGRAALAAPRS